MSQTRKSALKRNLTEIEKVSGETIVPKKLKSSPTKKSPKNEDELSQSESESPSRTLSLKSKSSLERSIFPRDSITPLPLPLTSANTIKIISWNVNGLKALVSGKNHILQDLIRNHQPDILCLQETKIQDTIANDFDEYLEGYKCFWHCSTDKKGYSGTAMLVRTNTIDFPSTETPPAKASTMKRQKTLSQFFSKTSSENQSKESTEPTTTAQSTQGSKYHKVHKIYYDFENLTKKFHGEGRTIIMEFDRFFLINTYVPNSGEGLKRLEYRINEWDPHMKEYLKHFNTIKPVIWTGDLNVGHLDLDIYNHDAKHIVKQAGLTPQERNSFSSLLQETSFIDAFRHFHPNAKGQFTYWSQRTFARPVNCGIRLDYFICSPSLFPSATASNDGKVPAIRVHDSYILHQDTVGASDHCPVILVLATDSD